MINGRDRGTSAPLHRTAMDHYHVRAANTLPLTSGDISPI